MSQRIIRNILIAICTAAIACSSLWAASKPTGSGTSHTVNHAPATSDAQLQAAIAAKLAKSKIGKDGFKFSVQKGVVTWEGATSVVQHKGSATRMARTAGALQVVNNIKVSDAAKQHAAANLKKAQVSD